MLILNCSPGLMSKKSEEFSVNLRRNMTNTHKSYLKLVHDDPGTATYKRGRTMEEEFLIQMTRANGGKLPTLEEFLEYIYPDGVPDGATLELDIPEILSDD